MEEKKSVYAGEKVYVLLYTSRDDASFAVFRDRKDAEERVKYQVEEAEERFRLEGLEPSKESDENSVTLYGFNGVYTDNQATKRWEIVEKTLL